MTGAPPVAYQPGARVVVAGASGLIGRALLARLAGDVRVGSVTALVRRPTALGRQPASVQPLVVDHGALGQRQPLPAADWAFCALGTTIQTAGSQAAFRAVDVDAVLAFALAARAAGATRLGLVSAMGADVRSRVFYNRCKGEVEQALAAQGWPQLVVARPSLLLGARDALGQPRRPVEALAQRLMPVVGWLIPRHLRPIQATAVATALAEAVATPANGLQILRSGDLQALADRSR
jgi:uncharacterized protein YbjT (DUF2867 family)